jgi:alkylation response protein AidB-like acyl-CoA dehydrogenase
MRTEPSVYLGRIAEIADIVRKEAESADEHRRLGPGTVAALRETGLMRVLMPSRYGGGELHLAETYPLVEALSRVNGSAGWNLQVGLTTTRVVGDLIDDDARAEVFDDPDAMIAGTINFMNIQARPAPGGWTFDGDATFLSGSSYADWIVIGGLVRDEAGGPRFRDNGFPFIVRGVVPTSALDIRDSWHVGGMRATASNDAKLDGFFVADKWTCDPDAPALQPDDPAAWLPLFTRFGAGIASVGIGAARGALDAISKIAATKVPLGHSTPLCDRTDVQVDVARAHGLVESGAAFMRAAWDHAMSRLAAGKLLGPRDQAYLRLSYITAAEYSAEATNIVMRTAGMGGLFARDDLERFWRDANTVPKHVTVSLRNYDRVGRILLDQPPLPGPI